jgi:ABC-type Fe3+ transport system substrate-binding protein
MASGSIAIIHIGEAFMKRHVYARAVMFVVACLAGQAIPFGPSFAQMTDPGQLQALIEQAKKEPKVINGRVTLALIRLVEKANRLFNEKFGLDKTFNITKGVDNTFISQMIAALDIGGRPELSFYSSNGGDMPMFVSGNYAQKIENWEGLLAEINPRVKSGAIKAGDVSPKGYAGYGFALSNRLKGVGYNTKTPLAELPQTYAQIIDPKYKGQYAIEPWTSHWEALGYNYYPNRLEEFIGLMNNVGKNSYVVSRSHQLIPRMAQGEIKFMTLNAEVVAEFNAKNPGAPLDYYFMSDMALVETTVIFLPPKGPAPATATLWSMFLSHPEVQALRTPDAPNVMYGEQPSDQTMKTRLQGKNVWDWEKDESTVQYWKWINAKENDDFRNKILKSIKQQR